MRTSISGNGTVAAGLEPEGNAQGEFRAWPSPANKRYGRRCGSDDSDEEAQLFQRRSSHSISWQVFAAQSRSSADQFRVRSPYGCHMSESVKKNNRSAVASAVVPRLFVLELNAGRIHSMNTDGSDRKTIVTDCHLPDGIVVDVEAGHIYWTNMGIPSLNDGSIERADIDGKNRKTIVAQGKTHTPKQIILDKKGGKLYWCDREGMRVMRCNLDGSRVETLIEAECGGADSRDQTRWCVGLTIEPKFGHIDWAQKGQDDAGVCGILPANAE